MFRVIISDLKPSQVEKTLRIQEECNLSVWSGDDYRYELQNRFSYALCAESADEVYGFLIARRTADFELDILNFGVSPECQKRGVGTALWRELLERISADKIQTAWLEVRESNLRAIEFYQTRGFVEVWRRKSFYARPSENAVVMKLEL